MFTLELFSCPDGIPPNSGLTGPNNTYIYILILSNAKSPDRGNDSTLRFSFFNTHVIQNPIERM